LHLSRLEAALSKDEQTKLKEYREARKTYREFKRLREEIGKPVRPVVDPETLKRALTGEDFLSLLEEIRKRRQ